MRNRDVHWTQYFRAIAGIFIVLAVLGNGCRRGNRRQVEREKTEESHAKTKLSQDLNVPRILWANRGEYKKDGNVVVFADCGLYEGNDSTKMSGVKCEYRDGQWAVLEPELEPYDNLLKNGGFDKWEGARVARTQTNTVLAGWYFYIHPKFNGRAAIQCFTDQFVSSPSCLLLDVEKPIASGRDVVLGQQVDPSVTQYVKGRQVTLAVWAMLMDGEPGLIEIQIYDKVRDTNRNTSQAVSVSPGTRFRQYVTTKRIRDAANAFGVQIRTTRGPGKSSLLIDDISLVRGYFPMGM